MKPECQKCLDLYETLKPWYPDAKKLFIEFINDKWKSECSDKSICKPFEYLLYEYRATHDEGNTLSTD